MKVAWPVKLENVTRDTQLEGHEFSTSTAYSRPVIPISVTAKPLPTKCELIRTGRFVDVIVAERLIPNTMSALAKLL